MVRTIWGRSGAYIAPVLLKYFKNLNEIKELTILRDWLLPMLMNGQVRVKGAGVYGMRDEVLGMVAEE